MNNTIVNYISSINESSRKIVIINVISDNCKIQNLTITKNTYAGETIALYINSSKNIIKNIMITNVSEGITLGISKNNNIIVNNQIFNNSIAIQAWRSSFNVIENNVIFSNVNNGIYLHTFSNKNTIKNNYALNNFYGIMIKDSYDNKVYKNCFKENNYGAYICCGSSNNSIYNNIFMNNSINNSCQIGDNYWYSDPNIGGNFWDDYKGVDENNDGYGDTPYIIPVDERQDIYPLTKPPKDIICNI